MASVFLLVTAPVALIVTSPPRLCVSLIPIQPPVAVATEMKSVPVESEVPLGSCSLMASPRPPPAVASIVSVNLMSTLPRLPVARWINTAASFPLPLRVTAPVALMVMLPDPRWSTLIAAAFWSEAVAAATEMKMGAVPVWWFSKKSAGSAKVPVLLLTTAPVEMIDTLPPRLWTILIPIQPPVAPPTLMSSRPLESETPLGSTTLMASPPPPPAVASTAPETTMPVVPVLLTGRMTSKALAPPLPLRVTEVALRLMSPFAFWSILIAAPLPAAFSTAFRLRMAWEVALVSWFTKMTALWPSFAPFPVLEIFPEFRCELAVMLTFPDPL